MSLYTRLSKALIGSKDLMILFWLAFFGFSACSHSSSPLQFEYTTSGSYLYDADKEQWGDFSLVLALSSSQFKKTSAFPFYLAFRNTGDKTITLDGILPYRNSASLPFIEIWSENGFRYTIGGLHDIEDNLQNDKQIVIRPGKQVYLIKGDLAQIGGEVAHLIPAEYVEKIASRIENGEYHIQGFFGPWPQVYDSHTDTLLLTIE